MLTVQSAVEVTSLWCQSTFKTFVSATQRGDTLYVLPTVTTASIIWIAFDIIRRNSQRKKGLPNGGATYNGHSEDSRNPEEDVEFDTAKPPTDNESGIFLDGVSIAAFRFTRFICVLALLSLQVHQVVFGGVTWIQVGLLDFYVRVHSLIKHLSR